MYLCKKFSIINIMNFKITIPLSFIISVVLQFYSCKNDTQPQQLILADSAITRGQYEYARQNLDDYVRSVSTKTEESEKYKSLQEQKLKLMNGTLTADNFSTIDDLENYYKDNEDLYNYCWALICKTEIYTSTSQYPSALETILKAEEIAKQINKPILMGFAEECKGDIFYKQQMYEECCNPYQTFYHIAYELNDSLRMTCGALRMATVYTYRNNVDSTLFYLKQAVHLTENHPQASTLRATSYGRLCEIYIQLEEYEKALEIMPRDSLNMANWAYWHYGQHHIDSAFYYFNELTKRPSLLTKAEVLEVLIDLAKEKKNEHLMLEFSERLLRVNDSIKQQSQAEETKLTEAQHKIDNLLAEKEERETQRRYIFYITLIFTITTTALLLGWLLIGRHKKLKRTTIIKRGNALPNISEMEMEGQSITTIELQDTFIYRSLKNNVSKMDFRFTKEQWIELQVAIDNTYNNFTKKILDLTHVSEVEMRTCYLIKIETPPATIATILCKSKSSITMLRSRLYTKITGKEGTAKDLDDIILNI